MSKKTKLSVVDGVGDAFKKVSELESQLRGAFYERDEEIRGLLLALLAGEHLLLLGPPGTAKSLLAKTLSQALGGKYFEVLLTKFSTPEEVFGPISLSGLENDEYRRVTGGYFPECEVAFLDEIFKSNSALLNSLLTGLNERKFDNGGSRVDIPLKMAIGASNELPQDDSLGALYDRFVIRFWVDYIRDRDLLGKLLSSAAMPSVSASISNAELLALQASVEAVDVSNIIDEVLEVRDILAKKHSIVASDRRWRKVMSIVRANAVLEGRAVAITEDLLPLANCLWDKPEDRTAIYTVIANMVSPDLRAALVLRDSAVEAYVSITDESDVQTLAAANNQLLQIKEELGKLDSSPKIDEICQEVQGYQKDIARFVADKLGVQMGGF